MTELRQRLEPIRSRRYLDGARGESCKLRFDGCMDERDTVVSDHLSSLFGGMGIKSSDLLVIDGCWRCHSKLDLHTHGLTAGELFKTLLRALAETLHARHAKGLLIVPEDKQTPVHAVPTPKRKPKPERKPIPQRVEAWPPKGSRKMQSRAAP
jgi:hypothetical protein